MANVTMDLNELDKLRNDLKESNKIITSKNEEIAELKSSKRTVRITSKMVETKPNNSIIYFGKYGDFSYKENPIKNVIRQYVSNCSADRLFEKIKRLFDDEINEFKKSFTFKEETTTEYLNFDDVVIELKNKINSDFVEELSTARNSLNQALLDKKDLENTYANKEDKLKTHYQEIIVDNNKKNSDAYNKLLKEFNDFKENKDVLSLHYKIEKLEKELELEKNKKWYQKIFK